MMRNFVNAQFVARLEKFSDQLEHATAHPHDPEAIHDLRVSIRRLVQCLKAFPGFFHRKAAGKARKSLKRLMDRCGAARDCDISIELLTEAGLGEHPVVARLAARRKKAERKLVKALSRWAEKGFARDGEPDEQLASNLGKGHPISRWARKLPAKAVKGRFWKARRTVAENAARVLPSRARDLFAEGDIAADPDVPYEQMHKFRLHGKHFRYTLELFVPVYGDALGPLLKGMKDLQDKLGAVNDCVTAEAIAGDDKLAGEAIGKLLEERETAFRCAWADQFGQRLRQDWLQVLETPDEGEPLMFPRERDDAAQAGLEAQED